MFDGSVGSNVMVAFAHGFPAERLPARAAREVFGDRRAVVDVALAPRTLEVAGRVLLGLEPQGLF